MSTSDKKNVRKVLKRMAKPKPEPWGGKRSSSQLIGQSRDERDLCIGKVSVVTERIPHVRPCKCGVLWSSSERGDVWLGMLPDVYHGYDILG